MKSSVIHTTIDAKERAKLGIRSGDTVRVWQKIVEKGKARRQAFEGLVLAVKHGTEPGATFTVRKMSGNVGVERIFPLSSPFIDGIEINRMGHVRRARLFYLRSLTGKKARIKEKRF